MWALDAPEAPVMALERGGWACLVPLELSQWRGQVLVTEAHLPGHPRSGGPSTAAPQAGLRPWGLMPASQGGPCIPAAVHLGSGSSRPNEKRGFSHKSFSKVLSSVLVWGSLGLFLKIIVAF